MIKTVLFEGPLQAKENIRIFKYQIYSSIHDHTYFQIKNGFFNSTISNQISIYIKLEIEVIGFRDFTKIILLSDFYFDFRD